MNEKLLLYDPTTQKEIVEKIVSIWGKGIFIASICNRFDVVFDAYELIKQKGYLKTINNIKNEIWRSITCKSCQKNEMKENIGWVKSIIPDVEDADWTMLSAFFQNATIALAIAVDLFVDTYHLGESQNTVHAANHGFECVYDYVSYREKAKDYSIDFTPDPLVQQELARQQRDLLELIEFDYENCDEQTWSKFVEKFRVRSENETVLPDLSDFME